MLVINCESSMRAVYGRSDGIEKGVSLVDVKGKWALITGASREIDSKGTELDIILNNAGLQIAYRTDYLNTPVSNYDISFKVNTVAPMMI